MENLCQYLTTTNHNELLNIKQKLEEFFNGTHGTWRIYPIDLELKGGRKGDLLATISSTKGTQGNVQKYG